MGLHNTQGVESDIIRICSSDNALAAIVPHPLRPEMPLPFRFLYYLLSLWISLLSLHQVHALRGDSGCGGFMCVNGTLDGDIVTCRYCRCKKFWWLTCILDEITPLKEPFGWVAL